MKLLKVVAVVICFITLSFTSQAQSVSLGIKAGPNFSKLSGSQSLSQNYNNRTGWHFGAYALIKLSKIGIQPELLYSKQGSTFTVNSTSFDANYDYINVPIIVKLYLAAGLNIQLGPQFGFATNTQLKSASQNYNSAIKGSDLSAAMGLGWDLPFGLSIDARYNLGLSNNNNLASQGATGEVKNQVIMASIGYRLFKLGN
jgi:hypothetical protein